MKKFSKKTGKERERVRKIMLEIVRELEKSKRMPSIPIVGYDPHK